MVCILARRCVWTKGPVGGNIEYKLDIWILRISVVTFLFIGLLLARAVTCIRDYIRYHIKRSNREH